MDVIVLDDREPVKKKLKQTRLPFQTLPPKVKIGDHLAGKKRKLPDSVSEGATVPKQIRAEIPEKEVCAEVPGEDELPPLGEREKNQPDISTIFQKKECFVDLSNSRVGSPVDDSVIESDVSGSELDDTAQSLNVSLPENKENVDLVENEQKDASNFLSNLKLTPKQLQRKLDSQKRHEEIKRQRQEKLDQKKKEREEKEEQRKKEREEKEEQRKKEREEKEEQRKKEREEKEEQKRKEKEEKDEQKRKEKEERDRKKQEEIERKENEKKQQELKKKKVSEAFVKFFVPKDSDKDSSSENVTQNFMPFAVKSDMRVAPLIRTSHFDEDQKKELDTSLGAGVDKDGLYLTEIKKRKIRKSGRTWISNEEDTDDDVVCIEGESEEVGNEILIGELAQPTLPTKMRVKLLQFQENRRPPYWGTWRKKSTLVKPRRPIGTDSKIFDYEIDSDDEWEEEEPGESLRGSDDEKDSDCDEKENEYDIDHEFMVPHGYLSEEEEALNEDDISPNNEDPDDTHKEKLKALEIEFQKERSEKTERLRPRIFGCIWANSENQVPKTLPDSMKRYFSNHQILFNDPVILSTKDVTEFVTSPDRSPTKKIKFSDVPEKYYPDLIRLLHGNTNGKVFLFKEFKMFLGSVEESLHIGKKRFEGVLKKLDAHWMACPEEGPLSNKFCWYVKPEVREKYNSNVTIPNNWNYILTPRRQAPLDTDINNQKTPSAKTTSAKTPSTKTPSVKTPIVKTPTTKTNLAITKFTKVLSEDERQKQFAAAAKSVVKPPEVPENVTKKRVQLTTLTSNCSIFKKVVKDDDEKVADAEVK